VTVVQIDQAAHAINFSHPNELAYVITSWLNDQDIFDNAQRPPGIRLIHTRRNS
jgi:hypothetical protein